MESHSVICHRTQLNAPRYSGVFTRSSKLPNAGRLLDRVNTL